MTLTCWEKLSLVVVTAIGLRIVIKTSLFLWKKLIAPNVNLGVNVATQGRWAVITGATDGLGRAYANALASKGLDIVLVSRSFEKLKQVAADIKETYGVDTRLIEADMTQGQEAYAKVAKGIEELEVGVLVNNVGASYDHPDLFVKISEETVERILELNVSAVVGMTRIILPGMMERRRGVIINISSALAAIPSPYLALYAATKAFIVKFCADLGAETASYGMTVQCIIPGPIATKMSKIRKATTMAPTPQTFVESALKTVGIESYTTGYLPHTLILGVMGSLRYVCEKFAIWLVARTMLNVRGRVQRNKMKNSAKIVDVPVRDSLDNDF